MWSVRFAEMGGRVARLAAMTSRELLQHHGDVDAEPGLLDFAVNVRLDRPPPWLRARLASALDRLGSYPSAEEDRLAREALGTRHGRAAEEVLPLTGAAECFSLLPGLRPKLAAVLHPSFTEPELALRTGGIPVTRIELSPSDGYRIEPDLIPEEADLIVLGNPTNPTSTLHPAEVIQGLARPGRVIVVDEAFADAVPGEPESLASRHTSGILVVRSLTKMWGLAGLRVGYALGEQALLSRLSEHRPHWPVSTLTLEALTACSEPMALAESAAAAQRYTVNRASLVDELGAIPGINLNLPASAPFLLLRVDNGSTVRARLRDRGIAVRRADTFPGLGAEFIRVAVREPEDNMELVKALREICSMSAGVTTV